MSEASDKLAKTRLAIVEHVYRKENKHERREAEEYDDGDASRPAWSEEGVSGWFDHAKRAASSWWRSHPASMGLDLATPMLSSFAAKKPLQFLAIAAAIGAVTVIARPWRLISVGGLIVALVKSSQLSSVVMSAMSAADFKRDHTRR